MHEFQNLAIMLLIAIQEVLLTNVPMMRSISTPANSLGYRLRLLPSSVFYSSPDILSTSPDIKTCYKISLVFSGCSKILTVR